MSSLPMANVIGPVSLGTVSGLAAPEAQPAAKTTVSMVPATARIPAKPIIAGLLAVL
jgi:TctA family transporter